MNLMKAYYIFFQNLNGEYDNDREGQYQAIAKRF